MYKHYNACSRVTVHNVANVDRGFFKQNVCLQQPVVRHILCRTLSVLLWSL